MSFYLVSVIIAIIIYKYLFASKPKREETVLASAEDRRRKILQWVRNGRDREACFAIPENIEIIEGYAESSEYRLLFYRVLRPKSKPKAMVCFVSGYTADIDYRLYRMAIAFARRGYTVFQYDNIAHGRSDGDWTVIYDFRTLVNDASKILTFAKQKFGSPNMDVFLCGHSMGGNIALQVAMEQDYRAIGSDDKLESGMRWNGAIITSPMIEIGGDYLPPNWWLSLARHTIVRWFPTKRWVPQPNIRLESVARPKEAQLWITRNPIRHKLGTYLCTAFELYDATIHLQRRLTDVHLPLLISHGGADALVNVSQSKRLYIEASSKDKTLKIYPNGFHDLFLDLPNQQLVNDTIQWMALRSGHDVFRLSRYQLLSMEEKKQLLTNNQHT